MIEGVQTLRATVKGYVQGVGFRVFARSAARRLGLTGYARNRPDGSVEVVACGSRAVLEELLHEIRRGPLGAHVVSVEADWQAGALDGLPMPFEVAG